MATSSNIKKEDEASKVIHKVNTSLSIIWGYIQLLEHNKNLDDKSQNWVKKVSEECQKLKELLEKMRK